MILRNKAEEGIDPLALEETEDGRRRERIERGVGVDVNDVGLRADVLVAKKRLYLIACAKAYVGYVGYERILCSLKLTESTNVTVPRCATSDSHDMSQHDSDNP